MIQMISLKQKEELSIVVTYRIRCKISYALLRRSVNQHYIDLRDTGLDFCLTEIYGS